MAAHTFCLSRGRDVFARRGFQLGNVPAGVDRWFCTCSRRSLSRMLPVLYNLAPGIISQRTNHLIKTLTHQLHPWPQALNNQSRTSTLISPQASSGIHSDIDSAQSCQLLCVQTEDCVAFSWHFGSEQFDENTCQLFSGFPFHTFTFTYFPPVRNWRGHIKLLSLSLFTLSLSLIFLPF